MTGYYRQSIYRAWKLRLSTVILVREFPIYVVTIIILAILSLAASSAPIIQVSDMVVGGPDRDDSWYAAPRQAGGIAYMITTASYGSEPTGRYDGNLWLLYMDRYGRVEASWLVDLGYTLYYYDGELLPDDSMIVAGVTTDYRKGIIGRVGANGTVLYYYEAYPSTSYYYAMLTTVASTGDMVITSGYTYLSTSPRIVVAELYSNGTLNRSIALDTGRISYPFGIDYHNGTIVIVGYSYAAPPFVIVINETSLAPLLALAIGDSGEKLYRVDATNSGIYIVGETDDTGGRDPLLLKLYWNGTIAWAISLETPNDDYLIGIQVDDAAHTVYASGFINRTGTNHTLIIVVDTNGTPIRAAELETPTDSYSYTITVEQGGQKIHTLGNIQSKTGDMDLMILTLTNWTLPPNCTLTLYTNLTLLNRNMTTTSLTVTQSPLTLTLNPLSPTITQINKSSMKLARLCRSEIGGILIPTEHNNVMYWLIPLVVLAPFIVYRKVR